MNADNALAALAALAASAQNAVVLNEISRQGYLKPDETAARFRKILTPLKVAAANGGGAEILNYAEALVNAASCSRCAFFEGGFCKALPPHASTENGTCVAIWPKVSVGSWCGYWRAA